MVVELDTEGDGVGVNNKDLNHKRQEVLENYFKPGSEMTPKEVFEEYLRIAEKEKSLQD